MSSQGPHRVTIPELAAALGVSIGTVSNALNGTGRVSDATRERILTEAARRGYVGNKAAQTLRTGRYRTVGLYLPPEVRTLSFYMEFAISFTDAVADEALDVLLLTGPPARLAARPPEIDGVVVVDPMAGSALLRDFIDRGVNAVTAGRSLDPEAVPLAQVEAPYRRLMRDIIRRLHDAGMRRPVMLAPDAQFPAAWALDIRGAFEESAAELGLDPVVVPVSVALPAEAVLEVTENAVSRHRPDAIVFGPQRYAGIARGRLGLGGPGSPVTHVISCAGDPTTELSDAAITSINPLPSQFGRRCADVLLAALESSAATGRFVEADATVVWSAALTSP